VAFEYVGGCGEREISKEEGGMPLIPSSTCGCVLQLKQCERRRQTVPSDINAQNVVIASMGLDSYS